ncbi:hypothetical protein AMTRI_Chr01g108270 [Amborella trichopoda]
MGVMTVPGSASSFGVGIRFLNLPLQRRTLRKPTSFLAFKGSPHSQKTKKSSIAIAPESLPTDTNVNQRKLISLTSTRKVKPKKTVQAVTMDNTAPCATVDLDYNEAAAALENIYKLSPATISEDSDTEATGQKKRCTRKRKLERNFTGLEGEVTEKSDRRVVRSLRRKSKRLSLEKRVALRRRRRRDKSCSDEGKGELYSEDVESLVKGYSVATDLVSLDWKKMKIPPVLPSSQHAWLFKLMQPLKAILKVKEDLTMDLGREAIEGEVAAATNMCVAEMRRHVEVGQAARNKLIKHNLRLVLFVINKYYQEFTNPQRFQDLCQAGAKGLIMAIDKFELKRGVRLSTYGLFWIRHSIMRSITLSSFTRIPFGIESVRQVIQRAKLEFLFEHGWLPTDEEIMEKVGISEEKYHDVLRASKPVFSLNAKHVTTQEELVNGVMDMDGVTGDKRKPAALLRLALDDVLDSLKPKESLVIRQRYGLDGKGDRTLSEIAGNLNISREMVRKHEVKALMKLKHPARVDYLRRYIV